MVLTEQSTITEKDLLGILGKEQGTQWFRQALWKMGGEDDRLFSLLGDFVQFNSLASGGAAYLAAALAVRQNLFRDTSEKIHILADRSATISARICPSSMFEYDGERGRISHRALAQRLMEGLLRLFGFNAAQAIALLDPTPSLEQAMMRIIGSGYGMNSALTDSHLFGSIGFHMGSACFMHRAFNVLDHFLHHARVMLTADLRSAAMHGAVGRTYLPYDWIEIHKTLELEHFTLALEGANLALQFYQGEDLMHMREAVVCGFQRFGLIYRNFMESLVDKPLIAAM